MGAFLNNEITSTQKFLKRTKKDSDILTFIPNDKEMKQVKYRHKIFLSTVKSCRLTFGKDRARKSIKYLLRCNVALCVFCKMIN